MRTEPVEAVAPTPVTPSGAASEAPAGRAVPARAGQTLWFHSRTPHRSGPNRSSSARRALYPTYNALAEGDLRDAYYRDKVAEFANEDSSTDRVRVSLIGDFEGRPVS